MKMAGITTNMNQMKKSNLNFFFFRLISIHSIKKFIWIRRKSTPKIAVGFSVIYGVFLLFMGVFLSLDTLAGELGSQKLVNTVIFLKKFFFFLNKINIFN